MERFSNFLKAQKCLFPPKNLVIFSILGVLFCFLGAVILSYSFDIKQAIQKYNDLPQCSVLNNKCNVTFSIESTMTTPIFFYYELRGFYQNYDQYMSSKNDDQLQGQILDVDHLSSCSPIIKNKDLGGNKTSWNNTPLDDEAPANPCGLIAKTVFSDRYKLFKDNISIAINEKDIVWDYERNLYKRCENSENIQWIDPTNEHFIVWNRISPLNKFRKIWGKIEKNLVEGQYIMEIENNYDVKSFNGEKSFVLSTSNALGQQNFALGYGCLAAGICNMFFVTLGLIIKGFSRLKRRKKN